MESYGTILWLSPPPSSKEKFFRLLRRVSLRDWFIAPPQGGRDRSANPKLGQLSILSKSTRHDRSITIKSFFRHVTTKLLRLRNRKVSQPALIMSIKQLICQFELQFHAKWFGNYPHMVEGESAIGFDSESGWLKFLSLDSRSRATCKMHRMRLVKSFKIFKLKFFL